VDGVLLVGSTPVSSTEKGQHSSPRYEFFQQIVKCSNRAPLRAGVQRKHLSWTGTGTRNVRHLAAHGLPVMAGSSLPVTCARRPSRCRQRARCGSGLCRLRRRRQLRFPRLETIQCMVERRKGGESGVKWVQSYRGDDFWKAYERYLAKDCGNPPCAQPYAQAVAARVNDIFPTRSRTCSVWSRIP